MPKKDTVTVEPTSVPWGGLVQAACADYSGREGPWLHLIGRQGGTLVLEAYVKGRSGVFGIGPTQAADESQPGSGVIEIGYWGKTGRYVATGASAPFAIE